MIGLRFVLIFVGVVWSGVSLSAETLRLGITQDKFGEASNYGSLIQYFSKAKIKIEAVGFADYGSAARRFCNGELDLIFVGSGVAAVMIKKKNGYPLLRPVHPEGWSTYRAVILAPKDFKSSNDLAKILKNRSIAAAALASSGEFFVRSILGSKARIFLTSSHASAIGRLAGGRVDFAVVKNRVWDRSKSKYPNVKKIGEDKGRNPNSTLLVSHRTDKKLVAGVKRLLLDLGQDNSKLAQKVKSDLRVIRYIPTTPKDFEDTFSIIEKAGALKKFNFVFEEGVDK